MAGAPSRDCPDTVACTRGLTRDEVAFTALGRIVCLTSHQRLAAIAAVPATTAMTIPADAWYTSGSAFVFVQHIRGTRKQRLQS